MPRPLVALAVMFALVIGAAAVLLYGAGRQRVVEIAERSAAPPAEELPMEAPPSAPAEIAATEEARAPTAEAPAAAEAETPPAPSAPGAAPMEQPQVAESTPPLAVEESLPPLEISGVEAASPSVAPTAEAAIEAFDLTGLAVAGVEAQAQGLALSGEAAPGTLDARDVTIKAAEVEAQTLYVAGEAPAATLVRIYADDALVGEVRAGADGTWLLEAQKDLPVGEVVFRVEAAPEAGAAAATPVVEASAPFMRYPEGVVLEPIVTATSEDSPLIADAALSPAPSYIIIRRGDNLWRIAKRNYGRGIRYQAILAANQDQISNPRWIFPGQVLVIPTRDRTWESVEQ